MRRICQWIEVRISTVPRLGECAAVPTRRVAQCTGRVRIQKEAVVDIIESVGTFRGIANNLVVFTPKGRDAMIPAESPTHGAVLRPPPHTHGRLERRPK